MRRPLRQTLSAQYFGEVRVCPLSFARTTFATHQTCQRRFRWALYTRPLPADLLRIRQRVGIREYLLHEVVHHPRRPRLTRTSWLAHARHALVSLQDVATLPGRLKECGTPQVPRQERTVLRHDVAACACRSDRLSKHCICIPVP